MPDLRTLPPGWELPRGARWRLALIRAGARLHQNRQAEVAVTLVLLALGLIIAIGLVFALMNAGATSCRIVQVPSPGRSHATCARNP